ncbi:MAG: sortase [Anaerolineaceae bacterium]
MRKRLIRRSIFPKTAVSRIVIILILAIALLPISNVVASELFQNGPYEVDVSLIANPSPSYIEQNIVFTVSVTPRDSSAGTASGSVEIRSGDEKVCDLELNAFGQASCQLVYDQPGVIPFQAFYLGINPILPGVSRTIYHTVLDKHHPLVEIIQDDPDPSILNRDIYANVLVSSVGPIPSGNVILYRSDTTCLSPDSSTAVDKCSAVLNASGEGGCSLPLTQEGVVSICSAYDGDYAHFTAISSAEPHRVSNSNTFTTITSISPEPSLAGELLLVQFTVTSPDGIPSNGMVEITGPDGNCTAPVNVGECSIRINQAHIQPVFASYTGEMGGQIELEPSVSDVVLHRVNVATTDIQLNKDTVNAFLGKNTPVAALTALDANIDESHSFVLIDGIGADHNDLFWIDGNQLIAHGNLPTSPGIVSFRVMTIDSAGLTFEKVLTLRVVDNSPELPETGFAAGQITQIPDQKVLYQSTDVTISIPRLGISIPVVGIPYGDNGWNTDWLTKQAGWLNGTAFPGWQGNSVLAAHNYLADGSAGPFIGLDQLQWGDRIEVTAFGSTSIYEVRDVKKVKPDDLSVLSHQDEPWLTLVTCKSFIEKTQTYRWRIIVQAVLVNMK